MAEVVAPGQDTLRPSHGKKRAADTALESEQRLSKRFDLLNIGKLLSLCSQSNARLPADCRADGTNASRLYIPVPGSSDATVKPTTASKPLPMPTSPESKRKSNPRPRPPPRDDSMQVEDTPSRVYIHDLDAELSDIESDEDNPIFLSDIEKHLAKIPKHILVGPGPKATKDNQLVLYNVPSSLTVPEAQDSVRRAILDARARMRENQASPVAEPGHVIAGLSPEAPVAAPEADAMDLD